MARDELKKHYYFNIMAGFTEFIMVASLHAVVPLSVFIGHVISAVAFFIYAVVMLAHIRHSLVQLKIDDNTE